MTSIRDYIATARVFDQRGIAGDYIAVLSYNHGMTAKLHSDDPITRQFLADAEARRDRYMSSMETGNRQALPGEAVYYVYHKATGTVLGLITADGLIVTATEHAIRDGLISTRMAENIWHGFQDLAKSGAYRVHAD